MDNTWIENTFDWCVNFLLNAADTIGITYEALNVWVFLIIVLLSLVISVAINFYLLWKSGRHKRSLPVMEKNLIKANPYAKTLPS